MGFKKDHPLADPKDNVFLKAGRDAHQEYFMITVQKVLCKAMLPFCLAVNAAMLPCYLAAFKLLPCYQCTRWLCRPSLRARPGGLTGPWWLELKQVWRQHAEPNYPPPLLNTPPQIPAYLCRDVFMYHNKTNSWRIKDDIHSGNGWLRDRM